MIKNQMARLKQQHGIDGFFGVGILNSGSEFNIGTLWRSAYILGASFIFTINGKYKKQAGDVTRAWTKIPLYHYATFSDFVKTLPHSTQLVGVEMHAEAIPIGEFSHPIRAVYLLGSESIGLSVNILESCHSVVCLPGEFSLNVSVAGSIVLYDRISQIKTDLPNRL